MENTEQTKVALLEQAVTTLTGVIGELKDDIKAIKAKMDNTYVTKKDFEPYQRKTDALWDMRWKIAAIAFLGGIAGEIIIRKLFNF